MCEERLLGSSEGIFAKHLTRKQEDLSSLDLKKYIPPVRRMNVVINIDISSALLRDLQRDFLPHGQSGFVSFSSEN